MPYNTSVPLALRVACATVFIALAQLPAMAQTTPSTTPNTDPDAEASSASPPAAQTAYITVPDMGLFGSDAKMATQVFKPTGDGPFPVVLFSHGRAGDSATRARLKNPVSEVVVRYWLAKGYAVVAPTRPGYGATGGIDTENSGVRYDNNGNCTHQPDHSITANAALRSTTLALQWVREQPWAKADRIVLQGQSVGGLTTIALCAAQPAGVVACINFAGGAGGSPDRAPARSCAPEKMAALMGQYGSTTRTPNIWLYAPNDQYWGEQAPKSWHAAFKAGGSPTQLITTAPVPPDGHRLINLGAALWMPPLDAWLQQNGL